LRREFITNATIALGTAQPFRYECYDEDSAGARDCCDDRNTARAFHAPSPDAKRGREGRRGE
jgi:hypothetical protein